MLAALIIWMTLIKASKAIAPPLPDGDKLPSKRVLSMVRSIGTTTFGNRVTSTYMEKKE